MIKGSIILFLEFQMTPSTPQDVIVSYLKCHIDKTGRILGDQLSEWETSQLCWQVRFTCMVSGRPSPQIVWYKGRSAVSQDQRHKMIVNEKDCHTLLITSAQLGDQGSVGCIARNRSGEASTMVI